MKNKTKKHAEKFTPCSGRCSFDMPQELFCLPDETKIKIMRKSGKREKKKVCKINWLTENKPSDIVAYIKPRR